LPLELPLHAHAGARALVLLHERHLRRCVATWQRAVAAEVVLPTTDDDCYASLGHLGVHILGSARHYMAWCCEKLELSHPGFSLTPPPDEIVSKASADLEHVLERWRSPLANVPPERFEDREYASAWKELFTIDSMLEHAVMHPVRHEFQLLELMGEDAALRSST
tara:strand:+ start:1056 stop:1550 length:495 start_codon:yes stop_codon:yes gene_type:complete